MTSIDNINLWTGLSLTELVRNVEDRQAAIHVTEVVWLSACAIVEGYNFHLEMLCELCNGAITVFFEGNGARFLILVLSAILGSFLHRPKNLPPVRDLPSGHSTFSSVPLALYKIAPKSFICIYQTRALGGTQLCQGQIVEKCPSLQC